MRVVDETIQNANIYTALEFMLAESDADRAYIMEFHNGGSYFSGRGQQKFSCTYEVVREGISAEAGYSQDHRTSNHHHYISELANIGLFQYRDIAEIKDNAFRSLLKKKGVQSIFNVPLKTLNGKIVGIVGVDYVRQPQKFDANTLSFMKRQARIMTGYLL